MAHSPDHSDRPTIRICSALEIFPALTETISTIGYQAAAHRFELGDQSGDSPRDFSATIVDDSMDNPLECAAAMSVLCPVLLITSEVSVEARLAAARAGVDAIIAKPLDVIELADWLNDLVGPHRETPIAVLIIDDDDILAQTYALALEKNGMRVVVETDPSAALGQITASYPDLILMDMQMPGMNGIELAKIVRQSRRHLALPIVFVSAVREPAVQLEARRWGGDDFVVKPVDPDSLVSLVKMRADRAITLRSMMERDGLTGLLNHGRFVERLYRELERCRRTGAEVSLVLIDVDRFKAVNDTYGHMAGDLVLRTLAQTLSAGLRKIDILGRYGGEEFALLLLDAPPDAARAVADRIRQRFSEIQFDAKRGKFSVTFSAGVSGSRGHLAPESLIGSADERMYLAKAAGRNRIVADGGG